MSATDAARQLGVSRKTYYQWEKKALEAMMGALEDGTGGRPSTRPDPAITQMQQTNTRLEIENSLLKQRLEIRQAMQEMDASSTDHPPSSRSSKKNG
ncbi:transposase [Coraliomargarita parva]|uniref:transposase n=1 Tax=Coraliomargarita parva TaxID=3014050 RepID=UPI003CE52E39